MADGSWDVTPDVERYDEAVDWFRKRIVITGPEARGLDARLKGDAFWVGGGLRIAQVQRVFDKVATAIEKGTPFEDFKKSVAAELRNPGHVETVFRNATQRAYNAGRYAQMTEPSTRRFRPFWLYDAILDTRTTDICRPLDKTLLPADDIWWDTHTPPLHHRCRSSIRSLRRSEAEKRGITPTAPANLPADGFGASPRVAQQWKPDPKKHEPALIAQLELDFGNGVADKRAAGIHDVEHWKKHYEPTYGTSAAASLAHGRAALERGLDLPVRDVVEQLKKLGDVEGFKTLLRACDGADHALTLREQGGEIDGLRKAAAAVAGHLKDLPARPAVTHAGLSRKRGPEAQAALDFFSKMSGPSVVHPDDLWKFVQEKGVGGFTRPSTKEVYYDRAVAGVVEHEWGHVLEITNPTLFERAKGFLGARVEGEVVTFRGFTKDGYAIYAWDDRFLHWYMGRQYAYTKDAKAADVVGTEITSTGLEALVANQCEQGTLEELARTDLEQLLFVLGQLAGP